MTYFFFTLFLFFLNACSVTINQDKPAAPLPTPTPVPPSSALAFFIIGVDSQSRDLVWGCPTNLTSENQMTEDQKMGCQFAKWKLRGVNTAVRVPHDSVLAQTNPHQVEDEIELWTIDAKKNGMFMIREPRKDLALDTKENLLLAFEQGDEPDLNHLDPQKLISQYALFKTTSKLTFLNISGGEFMGKRKDYPYDTYFAATDLISHDLYPITGWNQPGWIDLLDPTLPQWSIGGIIDTIRSFGTASKSLQLAYIETSNQGLSWVEHERGPTRDEVRGEIWDAVIHGAQGIIYFPEVLVPWSFDGTPRDVAEEITEQNRILNQLSPILLSTNTLLPVAQSLESSEKRVGDTTYRFTLNFSHQKVEGYGPYELKIFKNGILFKP